MDSILLYKLTERLVHGSHSVTCDCENCKSRYQISPQNQLSNAISLMCLQCDFMAFETGKKLGIVKTYDKVMLNSYAADMGEHLSLLPQSPLFQ